MEWNGAVFFYLSRLYWYLAAPSHLAIALSVVGIALLFTRWRKLGRAVAAAGAVGLVLIQTGAVPAFLMRSLEDRFPPEQNEGRIDGIVVLIGGFDVRRGQINFSEPGRLDAAVALALKHPEAKVVLSGGNSRIFDHARGSEAEAAGRLLAKFGIAPERLSIEDRSRNTRENALFARQLAEPMLGERWLLVTSAYHMPRAVASFKAVGLELEPYPVDFRTDGNAVDYWEAFGSFQLSMDMADTATREWIGLVAYRIAGYTREFIVAPQSVSPGAMRKDKPKAD